MLVTEPHVHLVVLDFSKTFDEARYYTLFHKLSELSLPDHIYSWLLIYSLGPAPRFWIFVLGQEGCMPTVPAILPIYFQIAFISPYLILFPTISSASIPVWFKVRPLAHRYSSSTHPT